MEKQKIAIIVCSWPPGGGGIGNTAYYHAKYLDREKFDFAVFTPHYPDVSKFADSGATLFALRPFLPFGRAGFMLQLLWRLKQYDIYHLYYPFFGSDWLVLAAKLLYRKKLIIHYQMDPIGDGYKKIVFKTYIKLFLGIFVAKSDRVIGLSEDHLKHSYLTPYYNKWPQKFVVVPNMVDTFKYFPEAKNQSLMAELGLALTDKIIIFVGCIDANHYFKGIDLLLRTLVGLRDKFPSLKLLIVGDGDRRQKFEQEAVDLGVRDKVVFAGWIDNEKLPDYYRLADVHILAPTDSTESFGVVIAEAQCCGIPSIVADWPGSRATLSDGETGLLVKPGDQADLQAKIELLLSDEQLRRRYGNAAAIRARRLYSAEYAIGELMPKIYGDLK